MTEDRRVGSVKGVLILIKTLDTPGTGQVISLKLSGQNGLIVVSYTFHGRSAEKCFGRITEGSSSTSGDHSCFSRDILNELELECFFFVFFICVSYTFCKMSSFLRTCHI